MGQVGQGRHARAEVLALGPLNVATILEPVRTSFATAINSRSVVAGSVGAPCFWKNGIRFDVTDLGGSASGVMDINSNGALAGWSDTTQWVECLSGTANVHSSPLRHAFVHANGLIADLGTLGGDCSLAHALNDRGDVVGAAEVSTGRGSGASIKHAFVSWLGGCSATIRGVNRNVLLNPTSD